MGSALPRPHQHPTLLLFVVGGITCYEVRQIREKVAACKTGVEVRIAQTISPSISSSNLPIFSIGYYWQHKVDDIT